VSNLLVISDLHLGGTLRGEDIVAAEAGQIPFRALRQVIKHDRALCQFIDYHRENPLPGDAGDPDAWTLVLNGDSFDFLHIDLRPRGGKGGPQSEEEQLYGLSFEETRSRWKLSVICRVHRRTLRALARFVDAGNELVFVMGNHDVDLWFEGVREDLMKAMAQYSEAPTSFRDRVQFEPWFYFEEGRAYIEHGHRFDPYNTFPDPLMPLAIDREQHLAPNFTHYGLRFFCNRVRTFPIHEMDINPVSKILKWISDHTWREIFMAVAQAFIFMWFYVVDTIKDREDKSRRQASVRDTRRQKLREFAARYGMPIARILALDALKRSHVGETVGRFLKAMLIDRIALILLGGLGTVVSFWLYDGWNILFATLGLVVAGLLLAGLFDRTRPIIDVHPILGRVAQKIGHLTGVPIVVFGHTHHPILTTVPNVSWLNPGSWEHVPYETVHAAGDPCTCSARYGLIQGASTSVSVRLVLWCSQAKAPVESDA
jgi:UDP-2,3-diacylglucosamine pyrophosphatase LpxH